MTAPFQVIFYLAASLLNLLMTATGLVGWCIEALLRLAARRMHGDKETREKAQAAVDKELDDLFERQPIAKIVGFLETELYLYGLIVGNPTLVGSVLLFKAFSGWLSTQAKEKVDEKSLRTLARYYAYAIGNFMSLIAAIVIYEGLRLGIKFSPALEALLMLK